MTSCFALSAARRANVQALVSSRLALGICGCQQVLCNACQKSDHCHLRCRQLQVEVVVVEAHLGCLLLQLLHSLVEAVHHAGQQAHIHL